KADSLLKATEYLAAVKIAMAEKPYRGRKPKPKPAVEKKPAQPETQPAVVVEEEFPNYTRTEVGKVVKITATNAARIKKAVIYQGKKKITFDPDDLVKEGSTLTINTEYLLKGDYEIKFVTDKFKERIPFSIK
ncbi:MAG: hypothetical protein AAFP92_28695, partial [Bacteroidota bacterium]